MIRFHDLRHTFAPLMFSNGEHPKIVQEIVGYAQITLTLDTYSHVLPSMQDGAVGRLGKLLD
jgi:site-specific recombinase XerD